MQLKASLMEVKSLFDDENIDFALIGGLALGALGYQRFTNDIDLVIHEEDRERVQRILSSHGYTAFSEDTEFLEFQGKCPIDILIARRPISKKMLKDAIEIPHLKIKSLRAEDIIGLKIQSFATSPKREFKEKADIQALIERLENTLDWEKIKTYADLFGKWSEILLIKNKTAKREKR